MKYIILAILIYFLWKFINSFNNSISSVEKPLQTSEIKFYCYYYGGFDDISVKEYGYTDLYLKKDCLHFSFMSKGVEVKNKKISYKDIVKVRFMNERNISQEVSLGKMVCFGWLSLAMKENKVRMKEYLVIDAKYMNEEVSIIIDDVYFHTNETLMTIINNELEKHRL